MSGPSWHDLCAVDDLADGSLQGRKIGGTRLCVGRTGDVHFAIDDTCPHAGGSLSEGLVDGDLVICPLHAYAFEVATGHCVDDPHCTVAAYPVRVEHGRVQAFV